MRPDTGETGAFRLHLPPDLLAASTRAHGEKRDNLHVEGWQPSLFGRLLEMLTGRRSG